MMAQSTSALRALQANHLSVSLHIGYQFFLSTKVTWTHFQALITLVVATLQTSQQCTLNQIKKPLQSPKLLSPLGILV